MGNFSVSTSNKKLCDLDFNWLNWKKERISAIHAEALFSLILWYKLNLKKIDLFATWSKNKMDFYYTLNKKLIGVDYELVWDVLFHSKKDMKNKQKVLNPYLTKNKIKEDEWFVKCGYPKIILRKFVKASDHKTLLNTLWETFQKNTFRKNLFTYDSSIFGNFYSNIQNDTYGSYKNSYNSFANISNFIKASKNDLFINKENSMKDDLVSYYDKKKAEMKYSDFFLAQTIITAKNGTMFLQKLKDLWILNLFSEFIEHYKNKTANLNNSSETISYNDIINSFSKKDEIINKLSDFLSAWKWFDTILVDIWSVVKNIKNMDFVYEKTEDEKKDFTNNTISDITWNNDFVYRTYLFPKNEKIQEKIIIDKLPI